jgi:hypothetical protein
MFVCVAQVSRFLLWKLLKNVIIFIQLFLGIIQDQTFVCMFASGTEMAKLSVRQEYY